MNIKSIRHAIHRAASTPTRHYETHLYDLIFDFFAETFAKYAMRFGEPRIQQLLSDLHTDLLAESPGRTYEKPKRTWMKIEHEANMIEGVYTHTARVAVCEENPFGPTAICLVEYTPLVGASFQMQDAISSAMIALTDAPNLRVTNPTYAPSFTKNEKLALAKCVMATMSAKGE